MNEHNEILLKKSRKIASDALCFEEQNDSDNPLCLKLYQASETILQKIVDQTNEERAIYLLNLVQERIKILKKRKNTQRDSITQVESDNGHTILNQIMQTGLHTTFSDIIGNENAKLALKESIILPSMRPDIFTGLRSPNCGILLLGPPGNGKTLLAEACAVESKCRFFLISASCLTSKWMGESEKLMRALFTVATNLQPSIIFFDEIDSLLSKRKGDEHETSRRLKTEFLSRFGGAGTNQQSGVLVIGATNRPQDIDDAVLRRFPKRIFIDMPEFLDRKEMLSQFIKNERHVLSPEDFDMLAKATEGFSGSDLFNLAKDATFQPIRELELYSLQVIDKENIRAIDLNDFILSLQDTKPSVKQSSVRSIKKWLKNN